MAGQGAYLLGHFHVEEDAGGAGEGEGGEARDFVEGEVVVLAEGVEDFLLVGREARGFLQAFEGGLLAGEGPSELEGYVVGVACQEGAVGGDEVDGAAGVGVGEASGECEDVAVVAGGDGGGDEGAAFLGGFDNNSGVAEGGDDAVAGGEITGVDGGAGGVFGDEGAGGFEDALGQGAVLGGIDAVQAVAEDGDGGQGWSRAAVWAAVSMP